MQFFHLDLDITCDFQIKKLVDAKRKGWTRFYIQSEQGELHFPALQANASGDDKREILYF